MSTENQAVELARSVISNVCKVLGTNELISVSHAHISGISYFNIGDYGLKLIESLYLGGGKFSVFTTANPYAVVNTDFRGRRFHDDIVNKQFKIVKYLKLMGAKAFTCAPYFIREPKLGEHLAWAESNAVLLANSYYGAKTNREGGPSSLMAALIGRTCSLSIHKESVIPKVEFRVPKISNELEASVLGYLIGLKDPRNIPYIKNMSITDFELLRSLLAALGASSSVPIAVLDTVTPLQAYRILDINDRISISRQDLIRFIKEHTYDSKHLPKDTLLIIGCPHLHSNAVNEILESIKGVNLANYSMELWVIIHTNPKLGSKELTALENRGIKILHSVCPVVTKLNELGVEAVITNSCKALHYIPKISKIPTYLMSTKEILRLCRR